MSLKIENSRRNDESRPVCMDLKGPDTPDAIRQLTNATQFFDFHWPITLSRVELGPGLVKIL
jgi:hypothetical protein